ncbi:PadR family transcriptional regulator [Shumkonia mesophila]|uniref:PadR family transcriptional regulator n=1 Tax=Shumkonia mesophila TaxID=2838854 RepID=UPI002934D80C|nr:PadR family transcriptional regulator [Shumkonia mesophila]
MDVKTLCLGVLIQGEASGYEIKKQLEEGPLAQFCRAGFGSIYPALGQLRAKGLATWTEHNQEGRPDKKIYRITDQGVEAFRKALCKKPSPDRVHSESLFMIFFQGFLDSGRAAEIAGAYREAYRQIAQHMREADLAEAPGGRRFVHAIGLAVYEALIEAVERNRHLLSEEVDKGTAAAER